MELYDVTLPLFIKMLGNMEVWLDRAKALAVQKKFDPELIFDQRLALDQFAFSRQIQAACDTAKYVAAKLTGKEAPVHPDTEKTLEDLRARLKTCREHLETYTREDFAGAEERACSHVWMRGKSLPGHAYVQHYALPNFFFHASMAYAILRQHGVDLGKADYLGVLPLQG